MPGRLRDWLNKHLGEKETPAHVLARFLAQFHAGPKAWGPAFCYLPRRPREDRGTRTDREADPPRLAKREQIGFIARTTIVEWRRRSGGCQRSPKLVSPASRPPCWPSC